MKGSVEATFRPMPQTSVEADVVPFSHDDSVSKALLGLPCLGACNCPYTASRDPRIPTLQPEQ